MINFHGNSKTRTYFEGWYFRHLSGGFNACFIPGMAIDAQRMKSAFIQVLTNDNSYFIDYPYEDFKASRDKLGVKIGGCVFTAQGVQIDIDRPELTIKGQIRYGPPTPLDYELMGPLRHTPLLNCRHEILSMYHTLQGALQLNGRRQSFDGGAGYIEKDYGACFPCNYFWTQCNDFPGPPRSVVAAVAEVAYLKLHLPGCFCILHDRGKEYRLATYLGARIVLCNERKLILKQGSSCLEADFEPGAPQVLFAPQQGQLVRAVEEHVGCHANYRFYDKGVLILELESKNAAYEYMA